MDTHIDAGISKSVVPVLAELDGVSARSDGLKSDLATYAGVKNEPQIRTRWIIGTLLGAAGLTVTVVGRRIAVLKAFGYL